MTTGALTQDQLELLSMLSGELHALLDDSVSQADTHSAYAMRAQHMADTLDNLANAAELLELHGLVMSWRFLRDNLSLIATAVLQPSDDQRTLMDSWVVYFLDFLQQLSESNVDQSTIDAIINFLSQSSWPLPLDVARQQEIKSSLNGSTVASVDSVESLLPRRVTPDMMSMVLSDDINSDLFEGLMIELPTQVAQFSEQLGHFIQSRSAHALANAQRIAHTLKGSANVVGIRGLANLTHFSEDLLEELSNTAEPLPNPLKNLLLDISDNLEAMLDQLMAGDFDAEPLNASELSVMQRVLNAYHAINEKGLSHFEENHTEIQASERLIQTSTQAFNVEQEQQATAIASEADQKIQDVPNLKETLKSQLRIKEEIAQDLLRLAGESAISTNRLQTQVKDVKSQVQHIGLLHNKLTQLAEEFGHLIEVRELFNSRSRHQGNEELDPLELDKYNELHSFFHQLQEFAIDTRDAIYQTQGQLRALEDLTFEQQVTNRSSQNHLLEMRMIPVNQFEARFQRCVRQACRLTGKQARFVLRGGDTMIDSQVLHDLVDPLMHLLRNAVDHGIESVEERELQGKSPEGVVELAFSLQGQSIDIRVIDDGAGLQRDRIVQKAHELSIEPPANSTDEMHELWLQHIIFTAGFSTRDQVSQTSGRGIGLDVVADRVSAMKGRIAVESSPHQGCNFSIRLPVPMITENGLFIASGKHQIAISSRGIEQLLFVDSTALSNQGTLLRYSFNQQEIDVYHFSQLAQLPDVVRIDTGEAHALLVVETLIGQKIGVLVDRVLASREMVVKPLTQFTPKITGVIGATVLGDGAVAPVLDVQELVLDMLRQGLDAFERINFAMNSHQHMTSEKPMALIVDDSLSTRRSLAQFIGDMGMEVRTAKDGFEAIEVLQEKTPQIMLVDMEMPRMNGLELTAHVRASETTKHIPVIMITSRNTEKHRSLASAAGVNTYLNKPYSEEELLHHIQETIGL